MSRHAISRVAFTLIELVVVVLILGIVAAVTAPRFFNKVNDTKHAAFRAHAKTLAGALGMYRVANSTYPMTADPGVQPTQMVDYTGVHAWNGFTSFGGQWDYEGYTSGVIAAVGADFSNTNDMPSKEFLIQFDKKFDDGDLDSGSFRLLANKGYYMVVAE